VHLVRDAFPSVARRAPLIIGVGQPLRGDDAAGLLVARAVRERAVSRPRPPVRVIEHAAEGSSLLEVWEGANAVVLIDAACSGAPVGSVRRLDASAAAIAAPVLRSGSTHAFGLSEAIELGRALGRLPARVVVYAIEGIRFDLGEEISAPLRSAIAPLAQAVLAEARILARPPRR
jgi:hydrogenase maturation protease